MNDQIELSAWWFAYAPVVESYAQIKQNRSREHIDRHTQARISCAWHVYESHTQRIGDASDSRAAHQYFASEDTRTLRVLWMEIVAATV